MLALAAGALVSAAPASAATISSADCAAQAANLAVRAVSISQGETITLQQVLDGTFQGEAAAEVFCRKGTTNLGQISDAKISVSINPTQPGVTQSMFAIEALNGVATAGSNPAVLGPFDGTVTFRITSPSNLLAPGISASDVGMHLEVVTAAWGDPLTDPAKTSGPLTPGTFGDVVAQTPELDSLALFGTGAVGMATYALTRFRARRRR
jgi:hypothetical protein